MYIDLNRIRDWGKIMTIDFKAEVEKRREDLLADLFSLLEINSERDDSKADK